jgi:hypothetical protein
LSLLGENDDAPLSRHAAIARAARAQRRSFGMSAADPIAAARDLPRRTVVLAPEDGTITD